MQVLLVPWIFGQSHQWDPSFVSITGQPGDISGGIFKCNLCEDQDSRALVRKEDVGAKLIMERGY